MRPGLRGPRAHRRRHRRRDPDPRLGERLHRCRRLPCRRARGPDATLTRAWRADPTGGGQAAPPPGRRDPRSRCLGSGKWTGPRLSSTRPPGCAPAPSSSTPCWPAPSSSSPCCCRPELLGEPHRGDAGRAAADRAPGLAAAGPGRRRRRRDRCRPARGRHPRHVPPRQRLRAGDGLRAGRLRAAAGRAGPAWRSACSGPPWPRCGYFSYGVSDALIPTAGAIGVAVVAAWALGDLRRARLLRSTRWRSGPACSRSSATRRCGWPPPPSGPASPGSCTTSSPTPSRWSSRRPTAAGTPGKDDPDAATGALEAIAATGRQALADMRSLLGVLREGGGEEYAPQPDVAADPRHWSRTCGPAGSTST